MMQHSVLIFLQICGFIQSFTTFFWNLTTTARFPIVVPPPPPLQLADGPEYEVASILDSKIVRNKLYYLVDWLGYTPSDRTWEPVDNVCNAQALIDDFHRRYPNKPGPLHC